MDAIIIQQLTSELTLRKKQIETTLELLEEGNTVPFIARYRKEATGELDEVQIRTIEERYNYLVKLSQRKEDVLRTIAEQGKLTTELKQAIEKATKQQVVEDLYRPYKIKKRTKATIAKEQGLEPLSNWLLGLPTTGSAVAEAEKYINAEQEINSSEEALAGAHEILAEVISDNPVYRSFIREMTYNRGRLTATKKKKAVDEQEVFAMYYDYDEAVKSIVPHRVLALNRGEKEDVLKVNLEVDEEAVQRYIALQVMRKQETVAQAAIIAAITDAYKRFIGPAIEREIRSELTEHAETHAIDIFGQNLRKLLLQSPLKDKCVLALDPAYRTGCKLAVLDKQGKAVTTSVIYPHKPVNKLVEAQKIMLDLIKKYDVEIIAIGNGTASRESEQFTSELIKDNHLSVAYIIVNEAGASVYSASEMAREEFPDLTVEKRSAISIGRRLQDPLAELVKIDPKSVGVGQYQHDVSQKELSDTLTFVVETAVNQVGVNVNTASSALLQYVSGLNKTTAQNIRRYREENGPFLSRAQLKKVPRLGAKSYEQSIGFLRIPDAKNKLDETAIHPESYDVAKQILTQLQLKPSDLGTEELVKGIANINIESLSESTGVGVATLTDVIASMKAPSRDLRDDMEAPLLRQDVLSMTDLKEGMELQGTVRNVVDFGAFIDIGVKQDGLVHVSKLSDKFVKDPMKVVSVGDIVTVWVVSVDTNKQRVALSMIQPRVKA
ncbi:MULTISPECIES: Tex family protein [Brochothrix]|uniref:RNA helicase transcriptional accessory protein n=1 Tax=Brochothrix thermosphacta TaxID=2756 RepID=A0A1D2LP95_BROTH|nr:MULTISPECIES: Tex family protein [Brochothrix]ANZ94542.1 RNA-binding transcriptional accessory protein [Brochothrix thermosphacta]ATF26587.1 RNA-binding transcriptional accessory protein [Brochothrix thermosphacta]MBR5525611.1 RNA-binding transcriptional accessory protein [Brochothrix sp.]MPQ29424.1 RNA-binding transcriptional accessory protein [Brochothrix thermosphacta]ODJ53913.1 RNA-binding transcriptional accessory protein [Brochothrix thermosphacta]